MIAHTCLTLPETKCKACAEEDRCCCEEIGRDACPLHCDVHLED